VDDVYPAAGYPDPPSLYVLYVFISFYDFLNVWTHYDNYSSCHMDISAVVCVLCSHQYISVRRSVLLCYSAVLRAVCSDAYAVGYVEVRAFRVSGHLQDAEGA
jgi:hypothetical protein